MVLVLVITSHMMEWGIACQYELSSHSSHWNQKQQHGHMSDLLWSLKEVECVVITVQVPLTDSVGASQQLMGFIILFMTILLQHQM